MSEKWRTPVRNKKPTSAAGKGSQKSSTSKKRGSVVDSNRKQASASARNTGKSTGRSSSPTGRQARSQRTSESPSVSEKLQKVLARAGFGSRREIEGWIVSGRVRVNGLQAKLGDRVAAQDRISLDGKPVSTHRLFSTPQRVIIYNKDFGSVCTRDDPEGRKTIFDDLPRLNGGRWISIGRLDINTSGLLLITTDGELANRLMHPSFEVEREYLVRVLGQVDDAILQRLQQGVVLDDGDAHFEQINDVGGEGANHWYRVVLREGRKREVRRLWESQGVQVSRLSRIRFANIEIPRRLRRGHWEALSEQQLKALYQLAGISRDKTIPASFAKRKISAKRKLTTSRNFRR